MREVSVLLLYGASPENASFSYQIDWPPHFMRHRGFRCTPVNVLDRRRTARLLSHLRVRRARFEAVVVLHSVFSNASVIGERLLEAVCRLRRPTAYFIGNEYKSMPEKMQFCERLGVRLLVTMNPAPAAQALYRQRLGCAVVCIPSGGLDTEAFRPTTPWDERQIDIGYRATEPPLYLGNDERRRIADCFQQLAPAWGFTTDISLDDERRLAGGAWAAFLNRCRGQLGTEAGGDYFELTDATRLRVIDHLRDNPNADMAEIFARFFADYRDPIPVRTISGRHVEAAGTKTVQILFEGGYNGYFQPDVHYIPVAKDLHDAGEALRKLRDHAYCAKLADNAYAVAVDELTYAKLIDRFHAAFTAVM